MANRTITNRAEPRRRHAKGPTPYLVRVLGYERPLAPGSRHSLDDLDEVTLGRGDAESVGRERSSLALAIEDPRMSQRHARMVHEAGRWVIEDQGSRNGTFVDGERVERATLEDGAGIELGRTAFVFRIGPREGAPDQTADQVAAVVGVQTWSPTFAAQLAAVARLAKTTTSIILHGETGTGKEVLARGIHAASGRSGPLIAVNCAALPANLIESELFGFKKGAFSGATDDRLGLIRAAHGGTLFLDEIGDLPAQTQVALLRVLQEREVLPIGATRAVAVDLRVVVASHRDLEGLVAAEKFREDLYARLAGFVLEIPSLRERREDLGLVTAALLRRASASAALRFSPEAGHALLRHEWPRNIRELEQTLTTSIALVVDNVIELEHLQLGARRSAPRIDKVDNVDDADDLAPSEVKRRDELRALLATHHGNVAAVARDMGVARMQIHRWLERFEIDVTTYRKR
ncbi:MAG: sigma 54-interacting transcriptional regulator [Myxococcales bacterium]|nr:sigma 54-interacting transcriptional regulator [Myxococcales bacterium]